MIARPPGETTPRLLSTNPDSGSTNPTPLEVRLATEMVDFLRHKAFVPDEEILRDYTHPSPQFDRAYERDYLADTGMVIAALSVKAAMRTLLTN